MKTKWGLALNKNTKIIIFGFALMLFGGIFEITSAIYKNMFIYSYGLYIGYIIILIGLLTYKNK